jgi:hypothetical protein
VAWNRDISFSKTEKTHETSSCNLLFLSKFKYLNPNCISSICSSFTLCLHSSCLIRTWRMGWSHCCYSNEYSLKSCPISQKTYWFHITKISKRSNLLFIFSRKTLFELPSFQAYVIFPLNVWSLSVRALSYLNSVRKLFQFEVIHICNKMLFLAEFWHL